MQNSKLGLDFTKVAHAKDVARKIADDVQKFVEQYSTVAVERTLCRLLGIDGVDANTVPLPNVLVLKESKIVEKGTKQELLNQNGEYKSMYEKQSMEVNHE